MDSSSASPPCRSGRKRTGEDSAAADTGVSQVPRRNKYAKKAESSLTFADPFLVWKLVAKRRFLTTPELARLLFLTNKTFVNIATEGNDKPEDETDDSPWKLLCMSHWGVEKANELLRITGMTAKGCFRSLAYPPKPDEWAVPPVRYAAEDYILIVQARKVDTDTLLFCESIPGNRIPSFFQRGRAVVDFGGRSIVNYMTLDSTFSTFEEFCEYALPLPAPGWKGSVHLLRRPDRKIIRLLDIESQEDSLHPPGTVWMPREDFPSDTLDVDPKNTGSNDFISGEGSPVLERLGCTFQTFNNDAMDFLEVELTLSYRPTLGPKQTKIGLVGFEIDVLLWKNGCGESISTALSRGGLQFAHVLESLREWLDAPDPAMAS